MLIVYTGNQKRYSTKKPGAYTFIKNIPIEIPDHIANQFDANLFEKYDENRDYGTLPEEKILVVLSHELKDFLCSVNIINRIKQIYPKCNIEVTTNVAFKGMLPKGVLYTELVDFSKVHIDYYKVFKLSKNEHRNIFNRVQLNAHSMEKLFLMSSGVFSPVDDKEHTVTINKTNGYNPTHIMLIKRGVTIGDTWNDLANHLEKQFKKDNVRLHVIDGYDSTRVREYVNKFSESGYCISCGDSPLNWLCLYMGVPLFTFLPETTKEIDIKQYDYFDGFSYSHIGITDNLESVYMQMNKNIGGIYGKKTEKIERKNRPIQEGSRDNDGRESRVETIGVEKEDSSDTVGRLGDNGHRRKRKRAVTVGN